MLSNWNWEAEKKQPAQVHMLHSVMQNTLVECLCKGGGHCADIQLKKKEAACLMLYMFRATD